MGVLILDILIKFIRSVDFQCFRVQRWDLFVVNLFPIKPVEKRVLFDLRPTSLRPKSLIEISFQQLQVFQQK